MPQQLSEENVAAMWQAYAQNGSIDLRDRLVEHYLDVGLVQRAAKRMLRSLPHQVEVDELISAGAFGLLSAVERFDPSRAIKFETFCRQPIRGAMLDYLREIDHLSRVARARSNKLRGTTERLRMKLGRPPGEEEVRRQLDVSGDTLLRINRSCREGVNLSLQHPNRNRRSGESFSMIETLAAADDTTSSLRAAMRHDMRDWVVKGLPRRDRLIVQLYYYEDMSMLEIGDTLGMSESRVSQLHATIITRLQRRLRGRDEGLAAAA